MAGAKAIKSRINTVKNTRKITRTMEMVSTAKSKKLVDQVNSAKPYGKKILEMMETLSGLEGQLDSPFLRNEEKPKKITLLVVTANRGLCGGYNSNVLKLARRRIEEITKSGAQVDLRVIGKKGMAYFKFLKIAVAKSYLNIDDTMKYNDALTIAEELMDIFSQAHTDRVEIISTVYESSSRQTPVRNDLMPIGVKKGDEKSAVKSPANIIYEPEPDVILKSLLPHLVRTSMFRFLLEAVTSEQIYRRIAMKSATDAAGDMLKILTRTYNRVRQAGITQELSEIVAGADAIS